MDTSNLKGLFPIEGADNAQEIAYGAQYGASVAFRSGERFASQSLADT
jgi:hypothetical protein